MLQRVHVRSSSGSSRKEIVLSPARNSEPAMGQEEAIMVDLFVFCVGEDIARSFVNGCQI